MLELKKYSIKLRVGIDDGMLIKGFLSNELSTISSFGQ
jgi:hypothetical protein